ncbi:hypothetical protein U1Q18_008801 [Sarracenia purpurea var. burkii]
MLRASLSTPLRERISNGANVSLSFGWRYLDKGDAKLASPEINGGGGCKVFGDSKIGSISIVGGDSNVGGNSILCRSPRSPGRVRSFAQVVSSGKVKGNLEGSWVGRKQTLDGWKEGEVERRVRGFGPPSLTRYVAPAGAVGGTTNPCFDRLQCRCGSNGRGDPVSNPRRLDRYKGSQPIPVSFGFLLHLWRGELSAVCSAAVSLWETGLGFGLFMVLRPWRSLVRF